MTLFCCDSVGTRLCCDTTLPHSPALPTKNHRPNTKQQHLSRDTPQSQAPRCLFSLVTASIFPQRAHTQPFFLCFGHLLARVSSKCQTTTTRTTTTTTTSPLRPHCVLVPHCVCIGVKQQKKQQKKQQQQQKEQQTAPTARVPPAVSRSKSGIR